jgi:hypothetical protein
MLIMGKDRRLLADTTGAILAIEEYVDNQYYISIGHAGHDEELLGLYKTYEDAMLALGHIAEQAQNNNPKEE